jgi:hypothetical protein
MSEVNADWYRKQAEEARQHTVKAVGPLDKRRG